MMKKSRYTETQVVKLLKEVAAGRKVNKVCRVYGISDATYYNWKSKYGGMVASDVKRLKELEDENSRPKQCLPASASSTVSLSDRNTQHVRI